MVYIHSDYEQVFNTFLESKNVSLEGMSYPDQDVIFNQFLLHNTKEEFFYPKVGRRRISTKHPKIFMPDSATTNRLNPGALVGIYLKHSDEDYRLHMVRVYKVDYMTRTYRIDYSSEDKPMILEHPMIHYLETGQFYSPQKILSLKHIDPKFSHLDDEGRQFCNGSHIVAIYDFGKPAPKITNFIFKSVDYAMKVHKKRSLGGRGKPWEGHNALNFRGFNRAPGSTSQGVYNGDLYDLVIAILSRRPSLKVRYDPSKPVFEEAYRSAGKPGYVGPFDNLGQPYRFASEIDQGILTGFKARVNIKTFTKYVLKNYQKWILPEKDLIEMRKEECRQVELNDFRAREDAFWDREEREEDCDEEFDFSELND